MVNESDSGAQSDVGDVSFQSNDSTLIDEGKFIQQEEFNRLVNLLQDLDPLFIHIYATGEELQRQLLLAQDWMDAHPFIDFTTPWRNIKILNANDGHYPITLS